MYVCVCMCVDLRYLPDTLLVFKPIGKFNSAEIAFCLLAVCVKAGKTTFVTAVFLI